ncbi:MAG: tetratricopeptide repeat protein [Chitinophagales bacterium]
MNTIIRKVFTLFITIMSVSTVQAQQTAKYADPAKAYKDALEIYVQEKYNIAYNKFTDFIAEYEALDDSKSNLLLADAYYYKASSAAHQKDPKTEDYYLEYINTFKGHSFTNVAYFDLGNWYFEDRDFNDALIYYSKVNERALNKRMYDEFAFKKGFCYFSTKRFAQAKSTWIDIINKKDGDYYTDVNYYYGMAAYYDKEYDAAIASFDKIKNVSKYKTVVPYYITQIKFLGKDYQGVIDYAVPVVDERSIKNKADINQLIGQSYFELGNYKSAVEYLTAFEKQAKTVTKEDYYQLGYAQYQTGDYQGAVKNFKELNHLNNALAQNALFLTGNAYLKLNDKENARNALQRASTLDFDKTIVEEAKFNYGKLSYELGYNNDALITIRSFIETYPSSKYTAEANEVLANVLLQTRNYNEALQIIEGIKNPSAKIQEAYQLMAYHKGISEYSDGKLNDALTAFNKAERYTPDKSLLALTKYWRGDIYHIKGEYEKSINEMTQFLASAGALKEEHTLKVEKATAHYVQGYNHYKLKDYSKAQKSFEQAATLLSSSSNTEIANNLLPDALLRTADCYFLQRNYNASLTYYDKVISKGYDASDYAFYQKGIIEGLKGNYDAKIDQLKRVMTGYPNSVLVDDALFEIGNTYILQGKNEDAINTFKTIIRDHSSSEWVAPAYLRMGLVYYNMDDYEEALKRYKTVVAKYPKTSASAEALNAIKDVYIAKGDPNGYINYLNSVPDASVTVSAQDSILYLSAENQFTKGQYDQALQSFNDYLLRFPKGYFSLPAHFYKAECYFSFQEFLKALEDYNYVLEQPQNRFVERSLQRASGINFYHTKDYATAKDQYLELINVATTEDNRRTAVLGMLRSNFQLKDYAVTIDYANRVIGDDGYTELQQTEAYYYRAKSLWEKGNKSTAIEDFKVIKTRTTNQWAAEGTYFIAKDYFDKGDLQKAEETCFEFVRNYPSYATLLVRTYMILADIYIKQDNLFKAKATMQSILDNYKQDDEWRQAAERKFAEIEALEAQNSKIALPDKENNELKFDDN